MSRWKVVRHSYRRRFFFRFIFYPFLGCGRRPRWVLCGPRFCGSTRISFEPSVAFVVSEAVPITCREATSRPPVVAAERERPELFCRSPKQSVHHRSSRQTTEDYCRATARGPSATPPVAAVFSVL